MLKPFLPAELAPEARRPHSRRVSRQLLRLATLACATWALASAAEAARVAQVSPEGDVATVRQVSLRFDADVVPAGDPRLPAPAQLSCDSSTVEGAGRWLNAREWVFDLKRFLPSGLRCVLALDAQWKPLEAIDGSRRFEFTTGGPTVVKAWPSGYTRIEEQQYFLLQLSGPVRAESLEDHVWCEVAGLGDRIPVRPVDGADRSALMPTLLQRYGLKSPADRLLLLACQRPLPAKASVRLVWGAGVVSASASALATRDAQRFEWTVREPFEASLSCERERAESPCMPLRPIVLRFTSPVPRALALAARLQPLAPGGAARKPSIPRDQEADAVSEVQFAAPLPVRSGFRLSVPPDLKDESGRPLANASEFPIDTATGAMPPIAKFAASTFGIVEAGPEPLLPITVRHVQSDLTGLSASGQVRIKRLDASTSDREVMDWLGKVSKFADERDESRESSLLKSVSGTTKAQLPMLEGAGAKPRPFEVMGIPLPMLGYHVVEVESRLLGLALLDKSAPMYVRTGALVTGLGVHAKLGRESSLVWVTTLAEAKPVAGAKVAVSDCHGVQAWSGLTDGDGIARIPRGFPQPGWRSKCLARNGWFISARAPDTRGRADLAFVFSDSMQGIEPWRFNVPFYDGWSGSEGRESGLRAHTVFDRTLLRVGEAVSMKHFIRRPSALGLELVPEAERPTELLITHVGSGDKVRQPLKWLQGAGAGSALSQWPIPATAKLGTYQVELVSDQRHWGSGEFRVEAFRLPLLDARLSGPPDASPALVAPTSLPLDVQINFLNGGALAGAPATVSAMFRDRRVSWPDYADFSFEPPRKRGRSDDEGAGEDEDGDLRSDDSGQGKIVAQRLPLRTDAAGAARLTLQRLPLLAGPSELLAELTFNDPNGEVQTVSRSLPVWPSAAVVGLQSRSWVARQGQATLQAVVLDTQGKPLAGRAVAIRAQSRAYVVTRKRMVGGFYAWDQHRRQSDLGVVCQGKTDERGRFECEARLGSRSGEVEVVAEVSDDAGRRSQAATEVYVTAAGQTWFAQDNDDRIDLLPERADLQPGQTARLQVRMPFREATALVTVEREGVLQSRVVHLSGEKPFIELPIPGAREGDAASWAPNVVVTALVVRGRVADPAPTAMVDLAKPAFKLGVAALRIGAAAHTLDVKVVADRSDYRVRQTAKVTVKVSREGRPAAGAQVTFAAVDEALLALRPNASWNLLEAMMRPHAWAVDTATAQGEIIGRRHYGRKALPPGGGGGGNPTRELFDTLLLWRPTVNLDAEGQATLEVPLNDALTRFRLVAVAHASAPRGGAALLPDLFGSGSTSISVSQDLQVLPGLPPLAREGDRFQAVLTLRNTTARPLTVETRLAGRVQPSGAIAFAPQQISLAPGAAKEVQWPVQVPAGATQLEWTASATETRVDAADSTERANDRVVVRQAVQAAVPVRVLQASLQALDGKARLLLAPPADALPLGAGAKQGGVKVGLQASLAGAMPGVERYLSNYGFHCLEQRTSVAVGLGDSAAWARLVADLPGYIDGDGLATYYPVRAGDPPWGSDSLTAYLLSVSHEAGWALPAESRERFLGGLAAFVEGRIERRFHAPRSDLDVRKLAALEALSRYGRAEARQLGSVQIAPASWPTGALIDWWLLLQRLDTVPEREKRLDEASRLLRSRLDLSSSTLRFVDEQGDFWWWLMGSPDVNANRLLLAALSQSAWKDDLPRLVLGAISRQRRGAWMTTNANAWGRLAVRRFAERFEAAPVKGQTRASFGAGVRLADWGANPVGSNVELPWPTAPAGEVTPLEVTHNGSGRPWLSVQTLAAIPLAQPLDAGYSIRRSVKPVVQARAGEWSKGDVFRVHLDIEARADMTWVALSDALPTGATVLGSGLGRDSKIATAGEKSDPNFTWPSYVERGQDAWRAVFDWLPKGHHAVEYTVRLSSVGKFQLPPTRIEAMYMPDSFGEAPNPPLEVQP